MSLSRKQSWRQKQWVAKQKKSCVQKDFTKPYFEQKFVEYVNPYAK